MGQRDVNININGKDNFSQAANSASRSAASLKGSLGALNSIGGGVGLGTLFSVAGLGALAGSTVKLAAGYEQTNVAFKTMLKSGAAATDLLGKLSKFAQDTPFQFTELTDAGKKLLAFGVAADDIVPTLRRIGDISSGIGAPIGEIAELYGKARVQGRLFAEDVNQFTGRGIPIIQELAKQFGVADSEVKKLVESGEVGFKNLEQAFVSMTTGAGQFTGLMVEQSKTLIGQWSSLKDLIEQTGRTLGENFLPPLKEAVAGLNALLGGGGDAGAVGRAVPGGERFPGVLGDKAGWMERTSQIVEQRKAKQQELVDGIAKDERLAKTRFVSPAFRQQFLDSAAEKRRQLARNGIWLGFAEQDAAKARADFHAERNGQMDIADRQAAQQAAGFNSGTPFAQRGLGLLNGLAGMPGMAFDAVRGGLESGEVGIRNAVQGERMNRVRAELDKILGIDPKGRKARSEELAMSRTAAFESRFRVGAPGANDAENKANAERLNAEKQQAEKANKQRMEQIRLLKKMLSTGVILKKANLK
jgi:tape measure domain-containing protein